MAITSNFIYLVFLLFTLTFLWSNSTLPAFRSIFVRREFVLLNIRPVWAATNSVLRNAGPCNENMEAIRELDQFLNMKRSDETSYFSVVVAPSVHYQTRYARNSSLLTARSSKNFLISITKRLKRDEKCRTTLWNVSGYSEKLRTPDFDLEKIRDSKVRPLTRVNLGRKISRARTITIKRFFERYRPTTVKEQVVDEAFFVISGRPIAFLRIENR